MEAVVAGVREGDVAQAVDGAGEVLLLVVGEGAHAIVRLVIRCLDRCRETLF